MQNQIFSGASETSAAGAIAAALAQIVVHLENGETLQIVPVDVVREATHWRATIRVITVALTPDGRAHKQEERKIPIKAANDKAPAAPAQKEAKKEPPPPAGPETPDAEADFDEAASDMAAPSATSPETGPAPALAQGDAAPAATPDT